MEDNSMSDVVSELLAGGGKHEINLRFNRSSIKIEANGDDSFSDIKKLVEEETGVPAEEQDLTYNGHFKPQNDKSLNYYRICSPAFFTLKPKESKK